MAAVLLVCGLVGPLGGCGVMSEGVGPLMVDPSQYAALHCKDLITRWKALLDREKELSALTAKASEGGGGTVIGAISYRADYEAVLGNKRVLQRTAAEKKCDLTPPGYQSDQSIR